MEWWKINEISEYHNTHPWDSELKKNKNINGPKCHEHTVVFEISKCIPLNFLRVYYQDDVLSSRVVDSPSTALYNKFSQGEELPLQQIIL
jgi:hypothetical protein